MGISISFAAPGGFGLGVGSGAKSGQTGRKSVEFAKGLDSGIASSLTAGWVTDCAIAGTDAAEINPAIDAVTVIRLAKEANPVVLTTQTKLEAFGYATGAAQIRATHNSNQGTEPEK